MVVVDNSHPRAFVPRSVDGIDRIGAVAAVGHSVHKSNGGDGRISQRPGLAIGQSVHHVAREVGVGGIAVPGESYGGTAGAGGQGGGHRRWSGVEDLRWGDDAVA